MVIAVLAMLFVMGSTLLIIARFERQTADTKQTTKTFKAVSSTVIDPILEQLRQDITGSDGQAYNRGWKANGGDDSLFEDYGDFAGYTAAGAAGNGDLLLSSIEPFYNGTDWQRYAVSWALDAWPTGSPNPNTMLLQTVMTGGPFIVIPPLTGTKFGDADGDGLLDSTNAISVGLSGMFGGSYEMFLRVVPHGGMVLIDRYTHPSLLAQVIHPGDSTYFNDPSQLWAAGNPLIIDVPTDESALRRRFMLPRATPRTDPNTLDYKLPVTLGFIAPTGAPIAIKNSTPHWWPVDGNISGDDDWWKTRLTPGSNPPSLGVSGKALTESGYNAANDLYSRRHLITTISSDDILRPRREEARLRPFVEKDPGPDGTPATGDEFDVSTFYNVINYNTTDTTTDIPVAEGGNIQYGRDAAGNVRFNGPGVRSAFSLRDVLDPTTGTGSYGRAMQLTAYYLAMIQHTTVAGAHPPPATPSQEQQVEQLRTAAQLAVNTIDYADADSTLSYFAWPVTAPIVKVYGVEKQPFITETYAKVSAKYTAAGWVDDSSIWAVELYNPYTTSIDLTGYKFNADSDSQPTGAPANTDLGAAMNTAAGTTLLAAGGRVVFANVNTDIYYPGPVNVNLPFDGTNTSVVAISTLKFGRDKTGDPTPGPNEDPITGTPPAGGYKIELLRTANHALNLTLPANVLGNAASDPPIVVDRMDITDGSDGRLASAEAAGTMAIAHWARRADPTSAPPEGLGLASPVINTTYWRHTSLQRHKEPDPATPVYWHFTMAYHKAFESDIQVGVDTPTPTIVTPGQGPVHDLLGNGRINPSPPGPVVRHVAETDADWIGTVSPLVDPIAGFPILVSNRGIDSTTGGCIAFPTTGSLLLVSRYGHGQRWVPDSTATPPIKVDFTPVTVSAAMPIYDLDSSTSPATVKVIHPVLAQMQWVDNGHMPIFDAGQICKDYPGDGRLKGPWGHLVFDYFTALPLDELIRQLNLTALGITPNPTRMVDLSDADYLGAYAGLYCPQVTSSSVQGYPLLERVSASQSPFGPKVRGRININFAPWWVLDGLPMLPGDVVATGSNPLSGVPVQELLPGRLDPFSYPANERAGLQFMNELADDPTDPQPPPLGLPNVSTKLAKYMISYREKRPIDVNGVTVNAFNAASLEPGFVTVGSIIDVLPYVTITGTYNSLTNPTMDQLRKTEDTSTASKPYSYLGFLQAVAPVVRLEDWATVKTHVFTVYSTIGTTTQPEVWLRTQVTVDRTRCFYSNDLPARITNMEPIGYYNAADD